ncbi:MAG: glycosyl transferase family 1 [Rhodospirillales bacterium 20-60-12]|nr:MAG: glycosyl transferase family 1 [Rhodospirillales bacterium 20-60-12]HQT68297.1 glycosyltransferase family 4 protein [Acetobacteraceae bacterium]
MRLLTFSTLFPNEAIPSHGVFVETRLRHLVADEDVQSVVMAPIPFFPSAHPRFGRWAKLAAAPARETRHGIDVRHPRYLAIPKIGQVLAPRLLFNAAARALTRLIAEGFRPDAIDAHYLYPDGIAAIRLGQTFNLPVVLTARGSDVSEWPDHAGPNRMIRRALQQADGLIAVSGALREGMIGLGADPAKVQVLRNGVDSVLFHPHDRAEARRHLGMDDPHLLSVGHLIERKGHDRVIRAMADLPGLHLTIVGEGPERERLGHLAASLGLAGRVHFAGAVRQSALSFYYAAAEALVLASSREGWANVLLESMACGTPVVASPIWGNPEVVRERAAGLIMARNDPASIVAAVRDLLANPPPREDTRAYAEAHGWREISAGQKDIFEQVITRHASAGAVGDLYRAPAAIF